MSPERPKTERIKRTTTEAPRSRANDALRVSETDIAARAFSYFCERGFRHGSDVEDWLRAERELTVSPLKAPRRRASASL